jgi:hypothetical protein
MQLRRGPGDRLGPLRASDGRPASVGAGVQTMPDRKVPAPLPPKTQWIDRGPAARTHQVAMGRL